MPFSLRLDPATEAKIRRLAAATRRSRSDVVREAVGQYSVEHDRRDSAKPSTFDRVKPFVGVVATGGAQLSTGTHAKYRASLAKTRGRRSR